jgi:tetratricopeptide (TPR) repeat protein
MSIAQSRVKHNRTSRLGFGCIACVGLTLLLLLTGCGSPARPSMDEEAVSPPPDLVQLDEAVRRQFDELWRRLAARDDRDDAAAGGAVWGELGQWFDIYGYDDSAGTCYRNARLLAPSEPRWPYYLGRLEESAGDLEAASTWLNTAAELAPHEAGPRLRLADMALKLGNVDRAAELYDELLCDRPRSPGGLYGRARVALARGNAAAAVADLERLAGSQPDAVEVRYSLAVAYRALGDDERAATELARVPEDNLDQVALDLDIPWDDELARMDRGARGFTRRGVRAFRRGDRERAVVLLSRAVESDPNGPEKRINYAIALRETGRWRQAAGQLREALTLAEPGTELASKAHIELGRLLASRGRLAPAAAQLESTLATDPRSVPAHVELGDIARCRGHLDEAHAHYAEARELNPGSPTLCFWNAAMLAATGRHGDAVTTLEEDLQVLGGDRLLGLLLARVLATAPDPSRADLEQARRLVDAAGASPDVMFAETMAMVAARDHRRNAAVAWQLAAVNALDGIRPRAVAHTARRRLILYQQGDVCDRPWEEREAVVLAPVEAP